MFENREESQGFFTSALTIKGAASARIFWRVFFFTAYAAMVTVIHSFFWQLPQFSVTPFEICGAFLGIILVFRTNAGYERWWEARKIWGGIVNQSRNLLVASANFSNSNDKRLQSIVNLIVLFPIATKNLLRKDAESNQHTGHFHEPAQISLKIGEIIYEWKKEAAISEMAFFTMDQERKKLVDYVGACERILKTPMPFVYAVKVRRFLLVFLLLVPLGVVAQAQWNTPFITLLVAYSLLGLDQIGKELQNPFSKNNLSHLPLDTICQTIEKDAFFLMTCKKKQSAEKFSHRIREKRKEAIRH